MAKPPGFLRLKIYRRTFSMYLAIVAVFSLVLLTFSYRAIQNTAQANFKSEAEQAFRETESNLSLVTRDIDTFYTKLYANPTLLEDFFQFFGATPAEYSQNRLESPYYLSETYLDLCDSLARTSGYTIRHMVYYSTSNLVDMEYTDSGYCRQRIIDMDTATALCRTGSVYTKDIHRDSVYAGKVSFILDLSAPLSEPFCTKEGRGICLYIRDNRFLLGDAGDNTPALGGSDLGISGKCYYCIQSSDEFGYTAVYLAPAMPYLKAPMYQIFLVAAAIILVFSLITWLFTRQFSKDADYLETILQSMEAARQDQFLPVETGNRNDEFSDLAWHLNALYSHLDVLIQQKYQLTIRQQQAQMDMLSAQLNPHFLYNTLERIRMRAMQNKDETVAEATAALGQLYRNIVKTGPIITIAQELEITRQYLDLMGFLYGDQFLYHCDVPEELGSIPTPKIWMQPIVENFFKHNFNLDDRMKIVVITGEALDGVAKFRIFDNQGNMDPAKLQALNTLLAGKITDSSGIGLQNVYHRLRLFYREGLKMSLHNCSPAGVSVEIQIQIQNEGEDQTNVSPSDRG